MATPAGTDHGPTAPSRRESRIAVILCVLAAVRVFTLSAAYPFFNNVDEQSHFDLVYKYSRGHIPTELDRRDPEAARIITLYAAPDYFFKPGEYQVGQPPKFRWPDVPAAQQALEKLLDASKAKLNFESTQPPLYYVIAGVWYRIGETLGLRDGQALYWVRFLNVIVCGLVTWLAYLIARTCFPDRPFLRCGIPMLVAFFPQDVFFSVNNDVLLPLVNGAAFWCLLTIYRGATRSSVFYAGTGLLVAAAILVKFSCIAILPVSAAMVVLGVLRSRDVEAKQGAVGKAAVFFIAAAVPIAAWCARNALLSGDVTGSMSKARFLGWTLKPLAAMLDHPIFTPAGAVYFWKETLATFWRGEFVWGLQPIASPGWDRFYSVSSLVLIVVAIVAPMTWRKDAKLALRDVLWPSLAMFALSLAFFVAISVMYDFDGCFYPSRALPYLTSGRLALGSLIPFAALYVSGLDCLLPARLATPMRFAVLIVPVAWMTLSEFLMSGVAFRSPYNWFHLF